MTSPKAQVEAARRTVLALPGRGLATLVVTGNDRVSWLNGLLTCDLIKWAPGDACYGLAVSRSGRVLADPIVVADGDKAIAVVDADRAALLREHLDHYLVMEDAEMSPASDAFETWILHGPASEAVLAAARDAGAAG